jgi:hypothetical protein
MGVLLYKCFDCNSKFECKRLVLLIYLLKMQIRKGNEKKWKKEKKGEI